MNWDIKNPLTNCKLEGFWWRITDLNRGHMDYDSIALTS
jgi:hypothetical protein